MSSDRFTQFVELLKENGMSFEGLSFDGEDEDTSTLEILREAVEKVYGTTSTPEPAKTAKPKTAYQLYVASETARLKKEGKTPAERKEFISASWNAIKALPPAEREKALEGLNVPVAEPKGKTVTDSKPKKPRKPTAYNLFMKSKMLELKGTKTPKELMSEIGPMWKNLPEEEKKKWTAQAKA